MHPPDDVLRRKLALDDAITQARRSADALAAASIGELDRAFSSALAVAHSALCDAARDLDQLRRSR